MLENSESVDLKSLWIEKAPRIFWRYDQLKNFESDGENSISNSNDSSSDSDDNFDTEFDKNWYKVSLPESCAIKKLRLDGCTIDFDPKNLKLRLTQVYCEHSNMRINNWCELDGIEDLSLIRPLDLRQRYKTKFTEMKSLKSLSIER